MTSYQALKSPETAEVARKLVLSPRWDDRGRIASPLDTARVTRDGVPIMLDLQRLVCDVQSFARWSWAADPVAVWVVEIGPSTNETGFSLPGCVWRVQGGSWTCTTNGVVSQGVTP